MCGQRKGSLVLAVRNSSFDEDDAEIAKALPEVSVYNQRALPRPAGAGGLTACSKRDS